MRLFTRKTATLAAVGAASGMFVLATPASAKCYPITAAFPQTNVNPCVSLDNDCASADAYYRVVAVVGMTPTVRACLP